MSRSSRHWISALVGGPVVAVLVLFIGCSQPWQFLGVMCGHNASGSLVVLTLSIWLAIAVVAGLVQLRRLLS